MALRKDPNALLDYGFDWAAPDENGKVWMAEGDSISISEWLVPVGLTGSAASKTATVAKIWLSGGTLGQEYRVTNRITTAQGRQDERSFNLRIEDR